VSRLRERTRKLHTLAEGSGYVSEIIHGRGSRDGYALFLRNLLPAYEELERGLERHRESPIFGGVPWADLYRAPALQHDLSAVAGPHWRRSAGLLPSAVNYARQLAASSSGNGEKLLAHAYVRYMGDLSGGQVLKRLLGRSLTLGPEALSFYEFPAIADTAAFKSDFGAAVNAAAASIVDMRGLVEEAATAFQLNIELSEEIHSAAQAHTREAATAVSPR
jgi:heme oxygenase (biliverdin-producing, ferredoxin)